MQLRYATYAQEVAQVCTHLESGEPLSLNELQILLRFELIHVLHVWSSADRVELVDGIAAIEQAGQRDALLSWVHLAPRGNEALTKAITEKVWSGRRT